VDLLGRHPLAGAVVDILLALVGVSAMASVAPMVRASAPSRFSLLTQMWACGEGRVPIPLRFSPVQ
ncbi:MAG: hypothetical protein KAQ88_09080, partial [Hyphomicrobiaceae bacterium]|nr:hypothetical protein [Hyphomicrobiaceae bacterium]